MTAPTQATAREAVELPNPRAFIDKNGGYQSAREGADKESHDAWVKTNKWGLSRDDFIRLSYFHGNMEHGSDGSGPVNGSNDQSGDVVYINADGHALTRYMVSYWLEDYNSFKHGYEKCFAAKQEELDKMRVALRELLEAHTTPFPSLSMFAGSKEAIAGQNAWGARQEAAEIAARAALSPSQQGEPK